MPEQAINLIAIVQMRIAAIKLGIEKLSYKNKTVRINFVSNTSSPFYQSSIFGNILLWLQQNPQIGRIEEKNEKLRMILPKVQSLNDCITIITELMVKSHHSEKAEENHSR